jgi:CPA2 family monovalent cation:H+ antiporter-2
MSDQPEVGLQRQNEYIGVYAGGVIRLSAQVGWADGTPVCIRVAEPLPGRVPNGVVGKVIVAGFGLAGRWIADIFDRHGIEYVVVDTNHATVEAQRRIGREVIEGDISDEATLRAAGIENASILALTVPDEQAVLAATERARRLNPRIYIVARTLYSSSGMQATQLGADEVVKAEQVVARQFYEMLLRKIGKPDALTPGH